MKLTHLYAVALSTLLSASVMAGDKAKSKSWSRPYGQAGCGLGSVIFSKHQGQISAATTNSTLWNQSTGIAFGLKQLNCIDAPKEKVAQEMDQLININRGKVLVDIVRGQGEQISVMAKILDCQSSDSLGQTLKSNFDSIYNQGKNSAMDITDSIISTLINNKAAACKNVEIFG